jgi:hypothetical protein
MAGSGPDDLTTARLLVRLPREADRDRFVELFRDEDFMVPMLAAARAVLRSLGPDPRGERLCK